MIAENLVSLHQEEERIRAKSIAFIEIDKNLSAHLSMIHAAMSLVFTLAQEHKHESDDELTIQYLGLRYFNSAASSMKLGLSGYYQSAISLVRDIFETVSLIDYFDCHPKQITKWSAASKKERIRDFGPAKIRKDLDKHYGHSSGERKRRYDQMSEYATHATAPGFRMLAPDGLGKIGPFYSDKYLRAWLEELVQYAIHGATILPSFFNAQESSLLLQQEYFLEQATEWQRTYFSRKSKNST